LEQLGVDALDLAGEELVDAVDDANGMGSDDVGAGGAKVIRRQSLEDLVRQPVGGRQRQVEGDGVGDTRAVGVRRLDLPLFGERLDLCRCAVHQHDPDIQ
jgi:hypothetical protein